MKWRAAWANEVNLFLEHKGLDERIDHRSFAEQGKDEQPTIHEGVAARVLENKGFVSDRCELNRQIRQDNALLRELKVLVANLSNGIQKTVTSITHTLKQLQQNRTPGIDRHKTRLDESEPRQKVKRSKQRAKDQSR